MQINKAELKQLLEDAHERYNRPDFIEDDPVKIPHEFSRKEDIEISGFLTALIAWGRRDLIIRSARGIMDRMDRSPCDFVMHAGEDELAVLNDFVHRTMNGQDLRSIILGLRHAYQQYGSLETAFAAGLSPTDTNVGPAILHARSVLLSVPEMQIRTHKHLANPAKGSSAKRINMFLRWMVRRDRRGVDFGLWDRIPASRLICPLDVHTGNVGRTLGLLTRKQNDWKAAVELTTSLAQFCPEDPVKYDFSLFGLGVSGAL